MAIWDYKREIITGAQQNRMQNVQNVDDQTHQPLFNGRDVRLTAIYRIEQVGSQRTAREAYCDAADIPPENGRTGWTPQRRRELIRQYAVDKYSTKQNNLKTATYTAN
jgi:hypothetical protein